VLNRWNHVRLQVHDQSRFLSDKLRLTLPSTTVISNNHNAACGSIQSEQAIALRLRRHRPWRLWRKRDQEIMRACHIWPCVAGAVFPVQNNIAVHNDSACIVRSRGTIEGDSGKNSRSADGTQPSQVHPSSRLGSLPVLANKLRPVRLTIRRRINPALSFSAL
jgi:hypothetical protein